MIQYTFEEGRDVCEGDPLDIWLFLGSSWKDDLPPIVNTSVPSRANTTPLLFDTGVLTHGWTSCSCGWSLSPTCLPVERLPSPIGMAYMYFLSLRLYIAVATVDFVGTARLRLN